MLNILFVCSKNKWRSPTAEFIYRQYPSISVKSGGTSKNARIKVNEKTIEWAKIIFVMERKHLQILQKSFSSSLQNKEVYILEIEDNYQYMNPELVDILKESIDPIIFK